MAGAPGPQARLVVRLMNMVVVLSLYWMGSAAVLPGMLAGHCVRRFPAEILHDCGSGAGICCLTG